MVEIVDCERMNEIVLHYEHIGGKNVWTEGKGHMFMCKEGNWWTGCDNRDGYAWTQSFTTMVDCLSWLYDITDSEGNMYIN